MNEHLNRNWDRFMGKESAVHFYYSVGNAGGVTTDDPPHGEVKEVLADSPPPKRPNRSRPLNQIRD